MANLEEGSVLGGRYQITGHVMTSADQDAILTGLDQVLNREVAILVASRAHASQVATSARQLATGERQSPVQILDLGLSDGRTYLVAAGDTETDDLLALVTEHKVYVEPFYTDTLGREIFGEARSYEPETYEDDDEYYYELDEDLSHSDQDKPRSRFLDRISERLNKGLKRQAGSTPTAVPGGAASAAAGGIHNDSAELQEGSHPQQPESTPEPVSASTQDVPPADPSMDTVKSELTEDTAPVEQVEPLKQDQHMDSSQPVTMAPPPAEPTARKPEDHESDIFTPVPTDTENDDEEKSSPAGLKLIGALALVAGLVIAVVVAFNFLGNTDEPPVAEPPATEGPAEPGTEQPTDEQSAEPTVTPQAASVQRVVPDSPGLNSEHDGDLNNLIDGSPTTSWQTYSFTQPAFGGFAQSLALVVELEEEATITEVTIDQQAGTGGSFTISVSNEPEPGTGNNIAEGSFTGPTYTLNVPDNEGEPVTGQYVVVNFTELPTLSNPTSAQLPYGLRIAEITVN